MWLFGGAADVLKSSSYQVADFDDSYKWIRSSIPLFLIDFFCVSGTKWFDCKSLNEVLLLGVYIDLEMTL